MKIPSLPVDKFITIDKKDIELSDVSEAGRQYLDKLTNELQTNAGQEGLVMPTQSSAPLPPPHASTNNIAIIQNNQLANGQFTCQFGTMLYDSHTNNVLIAVNNGSGQPIFKTVTLT